MPQNVDFERGIWMDPKELFQLKQPCALCPFRKENDGMLTSGRLEKIIEDLHEDKPFFCHKTVDYTREHYPDTTDSKYCAGAMVYLEKCNNTNVPMRMGQMFGLYDPAQMKGHEDVIDPIEGLEHASYRRFKQEYIQKKRELETSVFTEKR